MLKCTHIRSIWRIWFQIQSSTASGDRSKSVWSRIATLMHLFGKYQGYSRTESENLDCNTPYRKLFIEMVPNRLCSCCVRTKLQQKSSLNFRNDNTLVTWAENFISTQCSKSYTCPNAISISTSNASAWISCVQQNWWENVQCYSSCWRQQIGVHECKYFNAIWLRNSRDMVFKNLSKCA